MDEEKQEPEIDWRAIKKHIVVQILNVSMHTINKWVRLGCPEEIRKGVKLYDCGKILKWRIDYQHQLDNAESEDADPEATSNLEELRKYKAALAKFELEMKQGQIVEIETVKTFLINAADAMRVQWENLARRVAVQVAKENSAEACEKIISESARETLKEISDIKLA